MGLFSRKAFHLRMPRSLFYAILAIIIGSSGFYIYHNHINVTQNQRIERLMDSAAAAGQIESIILLGDVFTADYHDASGIDRATFLAQAQRFFNETEELKVNISRVIHENPKLPDNAREARAIVILDVSGKTNGEAFRGIGGKGADAFLVGFEKRNRSWKVVSSRYLSGKTPEELLKEIVWR